MNTFEREIQEKRRIAAGARHKKRGGRGCRLPSDCLTPAQLRRLNGNVVTYRLGEPMRYEAVMALPEDLRREYVSSLRDNYQINAAMLSRMLFVSEERAAELMKSLGVSQAAAESAEASMASWKVFCGEGEEEDAFV